jgi:hypothetical protein
MILALGLGLLYFLIGYLYVLLSILRVRKVNSTEGKMQPTVIHFFAEEAQLLYAVILSLSRLQGISRSLLADCVRAIPEFAEYSRISNF